MAMPKLGLRQTVISLPFVRGFVCGFIRGFVHGFVRGGSFVGSFVGAFVGSWVTVYIGNRCIDFPEILHVIRNQLNKDHHRARFFKFHFVFSTVSL